VTARNNARDAERLGPTATIVASVFAAIIGVAVGIITTFTHRQLPPLGLIAGLLIVGALIAGFRLVFESRIVAGAAALGVLLAVAVLALPGAGGSVVVADGILGYAWVLGTPAIAAAVIVWPGNRRRATE
jgi:N-acetyl-1-D-myo-inositol-2-amino-2-deoxy-alpha-D-glucopyranoside deacetylase